MKYTKALMVMLLVSAQFVAACQRVSDRIKLNQVGFYPLAGKVAVVTGEVTTDAFYITSTNLRDTILKGTLSNERRSAYSSTVTRIADFSSLKTPGSFVVYIPSVGHSYVFQVADKAYQKAAVASLKGFYYQRVSMPLEEKYAGKWARGIGHPDNEILIHPSAASSARPAATVISTPGGWYDAGDYNKYIVNSGVTMGTLLSAYEDFPTHYKTLNTNIPESKDAIADLLNEVVYNLRWMLSMQDRNDGGVYNKCTNASFDGMVMPGVTKAPRYVVQKGTAATLDFAAVAAQSARILKVFKTQLPGLSDSCLTASTAAWQWALKNPSLEYDQSKVNEATDPDISTGGYGDRNFGDEWLWAAAELFVSTKDKQYYDVVAKQLKDRMALPAWPEVSGLGYYTMLRFGKSLPAYAQATVQKMKAQLTQLADEYIKGGNIAFGTVMGQSKGDYSWGGSSVAANQSIALLNAYMYTNNKKYLAPALTNVDYLLGRNATGYCFVTGIGSKSVMHPHHRPSVADGVTEPVPGLLSGGPNPGMQDRCKYEFTEPETAFTDNDCSYASNEIAINWQAPLVYLMNAVEALHASKTF